MNTPCTFEGFPSDRKVLKVLTLGHSLTVDSCHFLALIANAEGDPGLKIATLYYSGCPLFRHVEYLQTDSDRYSLYESSSAEPTPPRITPGVTMKKAVEKDEWDVILMHGGTFEPAYETTYQDVYAKCKNNGMSDKAAQISATMDAKESMVDYMISLRLNEHEIREINKLIWL